jgi:competence protein ComGC
VNNESKNVAGHCLIGVLLVDLLLSILLLYS